MGSKYEPLWQAIQGKALDVCTLTFDEVKDICGFTIDHSFLRYKKELKEYGYTVDAISLKNQTVSFVRLQMIACCGLNCAQCDARIATVNNDDKLREKTAKKWAKMNNAPQITPETINCMGCRAAGVKFAFCDYMCEIRKCVVAKDYNTCGDCAEMETCAIVSAVHSSNKAAKNNLK